MQSALVIVTSCVVAFFLHRGLAERRPQDLKLLSYMICSALAGSIVVVLVADWAKDAAEIWPRLGAYSIGVLGIGWMFLAGAWAVLFLAEARAAFRS